MVLTTVERVMARGGGGSVKDGPVQEVDGGLSVDDLEDLTKQQAQLFSSGLQQEHQKASMISSVNKF